MNFGNVIANRSRYMAIPLTSVLALGALCAPNARGQGSQSAAASPQMVAVNFATTAVTRIQSGGMAASALLTGSAQLTTTGKVGGFVIFRYNPNGQEAVVPSEARNASSYLVAFDNSTATTGVAVSNASGQAVTIPVTLRDGMGNILGTGSIALSADGHTSFQLTTQFPQTVDVIGTAEFDAPSGAIISVLGIRSPPALTFTTLPALAK